MLLLIFIGWGDLCLATDLNALKTRPIRTAVIGNGAVGLIAAGEFARRGHDVSVFGDRSPSYSFGQRPIALSRAGWDVLRRSHIGATILESDPGGMAPYFSNDRPLIHRENESPVSPYRFYAANHRKARPPGWVDAYAAENALTESLSRLGNVAYEDRDIDAGEITFGKRSIAIGEAAYDFLIIAIGGTHLVDELGLASAENGEYNSPLSGLAPTFAFDRGGDVEFCPFQLPLLVSSHPKFADKIKIERYRSRKSVSTLFIAPGHGTVSVATPDEISRATGRFGSPLKSSMIDEGFSHRDPLPVMDNGLTGRVLNFSSVYGVRIAGTFNESIRQLYEVLAVVDSAVESGGSIYDSISNLQQSLQRSSVNTSAHTAASHLLSQLFPWYVQHYADDTSHVLLSRHGDHEWLSATSVWNRFNAANDQGRSQVLGPMDFEHVFGDFSVDL